MEIFFKILSYVSHVCPILYARICVIVSEIAYFQGGIIMEKDLIVIAKREDASKNIYGALSTFLLFTAFLVMDIIFYVKDKQVW